MRRVLPPSVTGPAGRLLRRLGRVAARFVPRHRAARVLAAAVVVVIVVGIAALAVNAVTSSYSTTAAMITVRTGPGGDVPVRLDTTTYVPQGADARHPAPAVLLAHGFGGDKHSVAADARQLAGRGYVVLTWTAQGFGRSGGEIHLNSPDWEVTDARRLIDVLATRPYVRQDRHDDPRVAVVGGSYGGGLALLTAAYDHRVDAIVPQITWNSLQNSLAPGGVVKQAWLGQLFSAGLRPGADPRSLLANPGCGRFADDVCTAYRQLVQDGQPDATTSALLARSSPAGVLDRIVAPTLLVQGEADSLFPLSEADANARGLAAAGTTVRVVWFSGGHDGGAGSEDDETQVKALTLGWLDHYLRRTGQAPGGTFPYSRVVGTRGDGRPVTTALVARRYPGLDGTGARTLRLEGPDQPVARPPDGTPAAISSLPGTGLLGGAAAGAGVSVSRDVPGQAAAFTSAPLTAPLDVAGAPTVRLRVSSVTGYAVLYAKVYDVSNDGTPVLVGGQVTAVRLAGLVRSGADATTADPVTVRLPGLVHRFPSGHRLRVVVTSTDQGYQNPGRPTTYTVGLAGGSVRVPQVAGAPQAGAAGVWQAVLAALVVVLVVGLAVVLLLARRRRARRVDLADPDFTGTPLVVRDLHKTYEDGFVAVRGVGFTVAPGEVVGLLGPNGAGKTTTLRMLLGLIRPTAGDMLVYGHPVTPGAPVLSRLGALVEGPGFAPHLNGLDNLRLYWAATGRPEADARLDEVLEIAALGPAVRRKVRAYSHGMRQRLAIAQAMLGMPDLLVLDEPTDGLDPPQIAEMRRVLQRYATSGDRAVLVSSHLLAEVEQTCDHVVVMAQGAVVAAGPVDDIVGESPSVLIAVSDADTAARVFAGIPSLGPVERRTEGFVVDVTNGSREDVVRALVDAGVGVQRVVPRRRLEDAFLQLVEER